MEKDTDDGSEAYYLQSVYHDRSCLVTDFPMLGRQIITRKALWGLSLLLYGALAYIPLY